MELDNIRKQVIKRSTAISILEKNKTINLQNECIDKVVFSMK